MNRFLLFMLAAQCCCSCMCMKKSEYDKLGINIRKFAPKRHDLKEYKKLLGELDYKLRDKLIQLSHCETEQQTLQRKQDRNYLENGEEIAAKIPHFATEYAAQHKKTPYKWPSSTNERSIAHGIGKHGILVDPKSKNEQIHNAINVYRYIQDHDELNRIYENMLKFADSTSKLDYTTHILEYCVLIDVIKNSESYVTYTYEHDIASKTVKSEVPGYAGDKIRVDCTGLAFLVKDLYYNDGRAIYALFIPVHHAYSDKSGLELMASAASIYPLSNYDELWCKFNTKRDKNFKFPDFILFNQPQAIANSTVQEHPKKSTDEADTTERTMQADDPDSTLCIEKSQQQTTETSKRSATKRKHAHTPKKGTKTATGKPTKKQATTRERKKEKPKQTRKKEWKTFDSSLPFNFDAWKEVTLDTDFRTAKQTGYASEKFSVDIEDSDTEETINKKITKCLEELQSFIQKHTKKLEPEHKKLLKEREASFSAAIKDIQANAPLEMLNVLYAALRYNLDALQQEEKNKPGVITKCYSAVHNNFFDFTVEHLAYDLWPAFMKLDKYWYYGDALAQVLQALYIRKLSRPNCAAGITYIEQKLQEKANIAYEKNKFTELQNSATDKAQTEFKRLAEDNDALLWMLTSLWICKLSDKKLADLADQSISILNNGATERHKTDLFDEYNEQAKESASDEINVQKKTELPQ